MRLDFGYLIVVVLILPAFFYLCAFFFNQLTGFLLKILPESSWLRMKISTYEARKSLEKTANKIDIIFTLTLIALAILLTFYYS